MTAISEAAERLRDHESGGDPYPFDGGAMQMGDERELAKWALTLLDPTPIDDEWLRAVGFKWHDKSVAYWLMHHRLIVAVRLSGQWWMEFDATYSGRVGTYNDLKTRGDVRMVCRSLHIKLSE